MDFTTLAKFVNGLADEIGDLLEHGLRRNELFFIDGCKMSSNVSNEWTGAFKELGENREKL